MEPIISPWIFYWIDLIDKLRLISDISCIFLGTSIAIGSMLYYVEDLGNSSEGKTTKKLIKISIIAFLVSLLFLIILPDKDTMTKMLIASFITPDNLSIAQNDIVKLIQDVATAISSSKSN